MGAAKPHDKQAKNCTQKTCFIFSSIRYFVFLWPAEGAILLSNKEEKIDKLGSVMKLKTALQLHKESKVSIRK